MTLDHLSEGMVLLHQTYSNTGTWEPLRGDNCGGGWWVVGWLVGWLVGGLVGGGGVP
jgi:hypothetical protein